MSSYMFSDLMLCGEGLIMMKLCGLHHLLVEARSCESVGDSDTDADNTQDIALTPLCSAGNTDIDQQIFQTLQSARLRSQITSSISN